MVAAELLRRVNERHRRPDPGKREQARCGCATPSPTAILAELGVSRSGSPTSSSPTRAGPRPSEASPRIAAAGYVVHGDLDDLRPSPVEARLPGEVSDTEVAGSAALALADLLVWARDAGADVRTPAGAAQGAGERRAGAAAEVKGAVRGSLARLASPVRDRRVARLEKRIAELEAQVEESRALHLRVATLSDVVAQLLLPAAQQDEDLTMQALRAYRDRSL